MICTNNCTNNYWKQRSSYFEINFWWTILKEKKPAKEYFWRTWVIWYAISYQEVSYILQKDFCCRFRPADNAKYTRRTCHEERGNLWDKIIPIFFSSVHERGRLDEVIEYFFVICHWFYQESPVENGKRYYFKVLGRWLENAPRVDGVFQYSISTNCSLKPDII